MAPRTMACCSSVTAGQDGPVVFENRHRLPGVRNPEHQPHEEGHGETAGPEGGEEVEG
jgi:hypothetical protein